MGLISETSSRIVRSPVMQMLEPPLISLPLQSEMRRIFTEVLSSPRIPHTHEEHTTRVTLSNLEGIWYSRRMRVESMSWVMHIVGLEGAHMKSSMKEQGGNMSVGGGSSGGRARAWSLIVGSVGAVVSGRVSPNFITVEDAQCTSSMRVIIEDAKVEIDGVRERGRSKEVSGTRRPAPRPSCRSMSGHSSAV